MVTPDTCEHQTVELLLPVGLPDVNGLWVGDAVLLSLLVQQVKKVFDGQRHRTTGAEDGSEQIIHELLQRSLR